jgi:transposase
MSKGKRLTEYERGQIDAFRSNGAKLKEIAQRLKRSTTVIHNYLKSGQNYGLKGKRGRKKKLNDRVKRNIIRLASNKTISA